MANYNYVDSTGVIIADTSEILADVINEYTEAFGSEFSVDSSLPQGQEIQQEVAARSNVLVNTAALANQINPNQSGGVFLDGICAFTNLERSTEVRSSVAITCTGTPGAVVPSGSVVKNSNGDEFSSVTPVTLDDDGVGISNFIASESGEVISAAGTVNMIVSVVTGWETANNPLAVIPRTPEQSDASLRLARNQTISANGANSVAAIYAAVVATPGVQRVFLRENDTSSEKVIDGVTIDAKSIYLSVVGGEDEAVAFSAQSVKAPGSGYTDSSAGTKVEEIATDPTTGQPYNVAFYRPDPVAVIVVVEILASSATVNPTDNVIKAVQDYADGLITGEYGFTMNKSINPFEVAGAINVTAPSLIVSSVRLSAGSNPPVTETLPIGADQYPIPSTISVLLV